MAYPLNRSRTGRGSRRVVAVLATVAATTLCVAGTVVAAPVPHALARVPSPNRGTEGSLLNSVTCPSSTSCVAVGRWVRSTF